MARRDSVSPAIAAATIAVGAVTSGTRDASTSRRNTRSIESTRTAATASFVVGGVTLRRQAITIAARGIAASG